MLTEMNIMAPTSIDFEKEDRRVAEIALFMLMEACLSTLPPLLPIERTFCEMHDIARKCLFTTTGNYMILDANSSLEDINCDKNDDDRYVKVSSSLLRFYDYISDAIELYGSPPSLIDMIHIMIWLLPEEVGLVRYRQKGKKSWIEAGKFGRELALKGRLYLPDGIPEFHRPRDLFKQKLGELVVKEKKTDKHQAIST